MSWEPVQTFWCEQPDRDVRVWVTPDGTEFDIKQAPPGAMWDAWWMPEQWRGSDGISLAVRLPNNHTWLVDSEASNCTRKGEPHECWVRHGDPSEAHVTVDKNGDTCQSGAGSILSSDYHGFLRDGILVEA